MRPPDLEQQLRHALDRQDWPEVERVGRLLDAEDETEKQRRDAVTLASAALWYAQQGFRVFPLWPGGKSPRITAVHPEGSPERATCKGECGQHGHGCHDAVTDPDQIRRWWQTYRNANIGLATGAGSGFDVIDVDGPGGNESLAGIYDEMPPRLGWALTPRPGGRHYYVPVSGRGSASGVLPGIDYRGEGGYVVAPPSVIHPGGKDYPGTYRWVVPLEAPA